jgi:hypothetical protein
LIVTFAFARAAALSVMFFENGQWSVENSEIFCGIQEFPPV